MKVTPVMRALIFPFLFSLLLGSCTSLPLPNTPEKSLLVLPCDISLVHVDKGPQLVGLTIRMVRQTDKKELSLSIPLQKKYATFAIDPGSYTFTTVTLLHGWFDGGKMWNTWEDTWRLGTGVYIEQQTILLNPLLVKYYDRADPNTGWDFSFWQSALTGDRGAVILAAMKKDSHWQAWEGYQMVNFPTE